MQAMVKDVLVFLNSLKIKRLSNSIINSARLPAFISLEGLEAGKHPLVYYCMKALHNINPSLSKYNCYWDVGSVMKYFSAISNNFKKRSAKLATLFAILWR